MSTTDHYSTAVHDMERAQWAAEWTESGRAEEAHLARAQVSATLALVDAVRELANEPTSDRCTCGHGFASHEGCGLRCARFVAGVACPCTRFTRGGAA